MNHIDKITISNARRFGENVEIEFGAGATIILAPNGVGKTTIFEAIEMALTGEIRRLQNSPDAIIRDNQSEMKVRLDFSGDKYYQVTYVKGGKVIPLGEYKALFGIENNPSLPYLFRLTHYLEQQSREWLVVEKDNKNAGFCLSQLPIGKDLQHIISKKTSLLKTITHTETELERLLNEANDKLSAFKVLKEKRDRLTINAKLTPLEKIVAKLITIGKLIGYEEYNDEYEITRINTYFEKIRVSVQQSINIKKIILIQINTLKERIPLYTSNIELLNHKQSIISEISTKIAHLNDNIGQTQSDIQGARDTLTGIQREIKELESVKAMFEKVEHMMAFIEDKRAELQQSEKKLDEINHSQEAVIEFLKKNERLRDQHKLISDKILDSKNFLIQAEEMKKSLKQWLDLLKSNQEIIDKEIPELEKEKSECLKLKAGLDVDVSDLEKEYLSSEKDLEALQIASNAIQEAVSDIRKNLVEGQRYCPVCQAEYDPGDLIKRIDNSLDVLNPAIPLAIDKEKKAKAAFELAYEKQKKESQRLENIEYKLEKLYAQLKANKEEILESILPQFPGCNTPEVANTQIEEQISQTTDLIIKLEAEKSQLDPEVPYEDLVNANLMKSENERSINELTDKVGSLRNIISTESVDINRINDSLSGKRKETILVDLATKLNDEKQKTELIQALEIKLSTDEANLKKNQDALFNENDAISKKKGFQESIYTEWNQAGLDGQPNEEALKIKHDVVLKSIDELEKAITSLNLIEQEIASWHTAELFKAADLELKKQIGDVNLNEEAYLESLNISVNQKRSTLLKVQERKRAVNWFLERVVEETEQIQEQVNTINEPWKKLLKRIIHYPLILNAPLLANTTFRNQPIAKTTAIVHNTQEIDIADIVSEAQITDLQLTFLLSMANKYQWTPWRALLLDDPTQHHDLVHASSVFDILRDYIIDFDYQVMMSTHDSTQAKFFQRKLKNEGVPSKIYQLVVREDGVTAERMT